MKILISDIKISTSENRTGEPYKWKDKIYLWPKNETILENLVNRRNRPTDFYKKEVLPELFREIAATQPDMANTLRSRKWGWRQKCGCTCPCSPGFVSNTDSGITVHATVEFQS